ncbi:MFS transporter [Microbacterium sp. cx-55]|uniref:MFS transporter n=1 Tax=unclassified Microbacterium TaxID=2609290 RepID=UPI001CBC45FC|nr:MULTISPECIES: MFS transporter [unclassified Microbacterium]MBZ4488222.1 MFS transporter [Microbacterium sp. cx-55]MCC4909281.1 MFS transporter [Microbacterium sp. cx-59]UGB34883.1 MFS transporter [Microbacterium sp. cx-55]
MFRSLGLFNYRVWFIGALVSNIGGWMQSTAQDWVVLTQLTDNDAAAMGVTMALQFGPPLLFVGATGWVADRFDRRRLLLVTQSALMALAVIVGILLMTGVMTLPLMFCFAFAFGLVNAFDAPARQAFVTDVVARENAANAVALNSASFNAARMIGPAVAGFLIVLVGTGWVFILNAATFLAMLVALTLIRRSELVPRARTAGGARLADGFRYVAGRPDLVVTFVMVFLIGAFGMNFPIFASTMALEFGQQADGYGILSSILAIGSLAGALLAARRDRARMRVIMVAAGGFGVFSLISAAMPTYGLYAASLVFVGFATVTVLTTANGYVQTTTDPALRGRVLALYMAVIMGATPIGAPIAGWVADTFGPRAAIVVGAVAGLAACLVGVTWLALSGRMHRDSAHRFRVTIDETRPIPVVAPEEFSDAVASTTPIPLPERRR